MESTLRYPGYTNEDIVNREELQVKMEIIELKDGKGIVKVLAANKDDESRVGSMVKKVNLYLKQDFAGIIYATEVDVTMKIIGPGPSE